MTVKILSTRVCTLVGSHGVGSVHDVSSPVGRVRLKTYFLTIRGYFTTVLTPLSPLFFQPSLSPDSGLF